MATTIAISGKGGSGKTTIAAMIIKYLCSQSEKGILAVDADPNCCLGLTLGVEPVGTIAKVREKARTKPANSGGTDRIRSFEYDIQQAITEADDFDLLTMGQPEGPDCYCAANNILRKFMDKLSSAYDFVVIDNEAGMEHLSRRTTNKVDLLCIVAEQSPIGALTAQRIFKLAKELPISVKETGVIYNSRFPIGELEAAGVQAETGMDYIPVFGTVPYDKAVFNASMQSETIFDVDQNNPAFSAVQKILEQKLTVNK